MTPEQEQLVVENERLAIWCTGNWLRRFPKMRRHNDEVLSAAYYGLVKAAIAYRPDQGVAFTTYAVRSMRNTITNSFRKLLVFAPASGACETEKENEAGITIGHNRRVDLRIAMEPRERSRIRRKFQRRERQKAKAMENIKKRTLWELTSEWKNAYESLLEAGGEIPTAMEQVLENLQVEESQKLEQLVSVIRRLETEADGAEAESQFYRKAAEIRRQSVQAIQDRIAQYLRKTDRRSVTTETGRRITLCKNGGKQRLILEPVDVHSLPESLREHVVTIKVEAVRAALENGETLPFARFAERGEHITIR